MDRPSHGLRLGVVILLLQAAAVAGWLGFSGRLDPVLVNDSGGYTDFPWHSWDAALTHIRTPGYPLLLLLLKQVDPSLGMAPLAHFLLYALAAVLFFIGLARLSGEPALACVAASTLLYSRILHGYVMTIATDTPAAAAGIATCGMLLWWLARPGWTTAAALATITLTGWLIRPANLFLVPLLPLLAFLLCRYPPAHATRSRWWCAGMAAALAITPLFGYALLRYTTVGRFSVVSFGGYNLVGITGQFLQPDDLPRLPPDLNDLASGALVRRTSPERPTSAYSDAPLLNYMRMETEYDATIWFEFVPVARTQAEGRNDEVNSRLRRLATRLLRVHGREYVIWLAKATRQAAKKVGWDFADNPFSLALILIAIARICLPGFLGAAGTPPNRAHVARLTLVIATVYLVLSLAVVIPVCPPLGRMTDACAVLLPAPLAVWLWPQRWMTTACNTRAAADTGTAA